MRNIKAVLEQIRRHLKGIVKAIEKLIQDHE